MTSDDLNKKDDLNNQDDLNTDKDDLNKKDDQKKNQPGPIPYERFKEVNERANKAEARLKEIEDKQKQADEKKLADERQWKELAEKREQELKDRDAQLARLRIAAKKGLPVDLVDRLKGETEEEIEADADKLLEFMKPDESDGVPRHKKIVKNTVFDIKNMTPKEIREHSAEIVSQGRQS